jgi:hypothetical protein
VRDVLLAVDEMLGVQVLEGHQELCGIEFGSD